MDNFEDEEFARIILFRLDFENAIKYFENSKNIEDKFIRDALIKVGIVTYAKPFMVNTGIHKEVNRYRLPKSIIPDNFIWIHEILMNYRGNFIGHSNFKTIKPIVKTTKNTPNEEMICTTYLDLRLDHWFQVDEEFQEYKPMIDSILELINFIIKDIPKPYSVADIYS